MIINFIRVLINKNYLESEKLKYILNPKSFYGLWDNFQNIEYDNRGLYRTINPKEKFVIRASLKQEVALILKAEFFPEKIGDRETFCSLDGFSVEVSNNIITIKPSREISFCEINLSEILSGVELVKVRKIEVVYENI